MHQPANHHPPSQKLKRNPTLSYILCYLIAYMQVMILNNVASHFTQLVFCNWLQWWLILGRRSPCIAKAEKQSYLHWHLRSFFIFLSKITKSKSRKWCACSSWMRHITTRKNSEAVAALINNTDEILLFFWQKNLF